MFDTQMLSQLPGPTVRADLDTPAGRVTLLATDAGLQAVLWEAHRDRCGDALTRLPENPEHPNIQVTTEQLTAYFDGDRQTFDIPLDLQGTAFQMRVWEMLVAIPFGETRSYGDLARELGDGGAARAVGTANANNPISIVVPCHRVVGASGKLTGYAGGREAKAFLLAHERKFAPMGAQLALF